MPRTRKPSLLKSLSGSEALTVLRELARRDRGTRERIEAVAEEVVRRVDADELADAVAADLELLDVEEVWARAGSQPGGYVDPSDAAYEMVEEALEPFLDTLRRDRELGLTAEVEQRYRGLLQGIHAFERDAEGPFKDWATDVPEAWFGSLLAEWVRLPGRRATPAEIRGFLESRCAGFAAWAVPGAARAEPGDGEAHA